MSVIKAFAALRPKPEYAADIAAPPFDVLDGGEAREMAEGNPYSFLHVSKAEIDLDGPISAYDGRVYAKAASNLGWLAANAMLRDDRPCLYIYRLTMDGAAQTGLVMCGSTGEYLSGRIRRHELTREDKERDRTRHIEATNANAEPVFLAYRHADNPGIRARLGAFTSGCQPVYDFTADDGIRHQVWVIDGAEDIEGFISDFQILPMIYIADGHHRSAAAANVAQSRRETGADPNAEYNYMLSVVFPDTELRILACNRVVKDLNGLSPDGFLSALSGLFAVSRSDTQVWPDRLHVFGMYLDKCWYRLELIHTETISGGLTGVLDVSVLQDAVLAPILGIGDPRTDKRIDFIGGVRGLGELEKMVDSGEMAVAFSLFPTSMDQLLAVAGADEIMPPKSTWFEPKLRSGLFIHMLK